MSYFSQIKLQNDKGELIDIQHPFPVDGDSVYAKDVWPEASTVTDWSDVDGTGLSAALIPFTNLHTRIKNETTDNPKILHIHFNRTVSLDQVGLGCFDGVGNFSNVVVKVLGSGGTLRTTLDDSANNTKYSSFNYQFGPELGNAVQLEFHTADAICLSNITIQKVRKNASRLQALDEDGNVINIGGRQGQYGKNLNVSLDQIETTTNSVKTISYAHGELHSGSHYVVRNAANLAKNTAKDILIVTPDTTRWAHMTIGVESNDSAVETYLYEAPTTTANGTLDGTRNRNRNYTDDNTTLVYENPTVTATGTLLAKVILGSGKATGGGARDNEEFVLKQNTKYLLRIVEPNVAATNINWNLDWYEHTNLS